MKHAVIFHGWGADSESNWFPWLKAELLKKGFSVIVPDFPHSQMPTIDEWLSYFEKNIAPKIKPSQTILIGHSLGVPAILRLLESWDFEKRGIFTSAFLISAFDRSLGIPEIDNFVDHPFDWQNIKKSVVKTTVINSDNDPYIPVWIGKDVALQLGSEYILEHNGEHLNAPAGYLEFPKLLTLILNK